MNRVLTLETVAEFLEEIQRLMELNGENPFKSRAYERASTTVRGLTGAEELVERARAGTLTELTGIGKGISETLTEFILKGTSQARDELSKSLPEGLLELIQIPGLGPKKARTLIEELGITSIPELAYACKENRLLQIKGFGQKAQDKIGDAIQFLNSTRGLQKISDVLERSEELLLLLKKAVQSGRRPSGDSLRVSATGELRRRLEILSGIDFLVEVPEAKDVAAEIEERARGVIDAEISKQPIGLPVRLEFVPTSRFAFALAQSTATEKHWVALGQPKEAGHRSEEEFYSSLGLNWIPPESRETGEEVEMARGQAIDLLPWDGVQGIFHNHTTRSDGNDSLEAMVIASKKLGYHYIGISDHSQSAFYAQGLKKDALKEQEREVREVQERHPEIKIFWGVESDILADGSLDYEDSVLKRFDFVIASVHSRFGMDHQTMTDRLVRAIENPFTRFLGHSTGRLLLGRKPYEMDMAKVIRTAAKCNVAIEINANPARLDIDWRWGGELRRHKTMVSINPDAHGVSGLSDTHYGIGVARKALLPVAQVVNSRSASEVAEWLSRG